MGALVNSGGRAAKIGAEVISVIADAATLPPSDAARAIRKVITGKADPSTLPDSEQFASTVIRDKDHTVLIVVSRDPER